MQVHMHESHLSNHKYDCTNMDFQTDKLEFDLSSAHGKNIYTPPKKIRSPEVVRIATRVSIINIFVLIAYYGHTLQNSIPKSNLQLMLLCQGITSYITATDNVILRYSILELSPGSL